MTTITAPFAQQAFGSIPASDPVPFVGSSLAEYEQSLALDLPALKGRDVLDVGAGPASFTVEAIARRIDAVAVDPLYGDPGGSLRARIELDYARTGARTRPRAFRPSGFPWPAAAAPDSRAAAERFLADYDSGFARGRYVPGALPQLPFFDGTFDLVLCAHVLFTAPADFGFEWHVAACRELIRVCAEAVRIYPVCAPDGRTYPGLGRLRRELRSSGIASQTIGNGRFADSGSVLVLRRATP